MATRAAAISRRPSRPNITCEARDTSTVSRVPRVTVDVYLATCDFMFYFFVVAMQSANMAATSEECATLTTTSSSTTSPCHPLTAATHRSALTIG